MHTFNSIQDQHMNGEIQKLSLLKHFQFYPRSTPFIYTRHIPWGSSFNSIQDQHNNTCCRTEPCPIAFNSIQDQLTVRIGVIKIVIPSFNSIQDQRDPRQAYYEKVRDVFQFYPRSTHLNNP